MPAPVELVQIALVDVLVALSNNAQFFEVPTLAPAPGAWDDRSNGDGSSSRLLTADPGSLLHNAQLFSVFVQPHGRTDLLLPAGCNVRIATYLSAEFLLQHSHIVPAAAIAPQDTSAPGETAAGFDPLLAGSEGLRGPQTMCPAITALLESYAAGTRQPQSMAEALVAAGLVLGCTWGMGYAGCSDKRLPLATYRLAVRAALGLAAAAQRPGFPTVSSIGLAEDCPGITRATLDPVRCAKPLLH